MQHVSMSVQYNSFLSQTKSENTPKAILARKKRVLNYILCAAPNMLYNCPYRVDKSTSSQEGDRSDLFRYLYIVYDSLNILLHICTTFICFHHSAVMLGSYSIPASQQNGVCQPSPVSPNPPYQLYVGSATPHLSKYTLLNQTPHRHKLCRYILYEESPREATFSLMTCHFLGDFSYLS